MHNAPDFIQIPNQVFMDRELSGIDMLTYGLVYWYTKLKNEKCYASNKTFSDLLGVQPRKVSEAISRLQKQGYINVVYKDKSKRHRVEIIPLVIYKKIVRTDIQDSPNGHTIDSPNGLQKKNIIRRKENNTSTEKNSVQISELIKSFEKINADCKNYYSHKVQRGACEFLILEYGFERVNKIISRTLPITNFIDFFPVITTPVQLRKKWATLESAVVKKQLEAKNKKEKYKVAFTS